MPTGTELVSGALRCISSLAPGEPVTGEEADYALSVLNLMLAAWSAEDLMVPARTIESLALAAGNGSRTIGTGAQLNTARPDLVTDAYLRDAGNQDFALDVTMTKEEYNAIRLKSVTGRPCRLYYDPQYPSGVIYFDLTTDTDYTLYLESLKPVAQFATLAATVVMPGEYGEAVKYLLAERLAPEYGTAIGPDLRKLIEDARRRITRKNLTRKAAVFDAGVLKPPQYDIRRG